MADANFLHFVPIFSELSDETLETIYHTGKIVDYDKEQIVFMEEDDGTAMFFIIKGQVKITRSSSDGKEVILSILSDSDFFGEMALLDGLSRSASVTTTDQTKLFILERVKFLDLLTKHPEVSIALLRELTKRLRDADLKIKSLSLKDAEGKVASVLLQLADDIGKIKHGIVEIEKLPLQQDLANMAGTSRETISRTIHSFAKRELIELEGSKLRILNYEKFKETFI